MKKSAVSLAVLATISSASAIGASFSITSGTTTSGQTLDSNETGTVASGATLSTADATVAVTVRDGTSSLTNSGTISQTSTGLTIYANTGTPVFTLTNQAGGVISASGNVVIRLNRSVGSYLIDNQGTIEQIGPAVDGERAIRADANYLSTNNRIINGSTTNSAAIIRSTGDDALRLGKNFTLTNYGSIYSTGTVNTSCPDYMTCDDDYSAADGVAIEDSRANVAILNYGTITGPRHAIDGGEPVVASADADLIGVDQLTVTATTPNGVTFDKTVGGVTTAGVKIDNPVIINYAAGVLTGNNGSGVGLDGHGVVINYGSITGNYAGAGNVYDHEGAGVTINNGDGDGVDIDGVAYVDNYGTIRGEGAGGYDSGGNPNGADGIAAGGGTIINRAGATIYGQSKGILIDDGANGTAIVAQRGTATATGSDAKIVNYGTITGATKTAVGLVGNFADSLTNHSTGVITGGTGSVRVDQLSSTTAAAAVQMGDGNDTLTNYGRIEGQNGLAIDMGAGDDTLSLFHNGSTGVVIGTIAGGTGANTLQFNVGAAMSYAYSTTGTWTLTDLDNRPVVSGSAIAAGIGNAETADEMQFLRLTQLNNSLSHRPTRYALANGERQAWADSFYLNSERSKSSTNATIEDYKADGHGVTVGMPALVKGLNADFILGAQQTALDIDTGSQTIDITSLRAGLLFPDLWKKENTRVAGKATIGYNAHNSERRVLVNDNTSTGITTYTADYASWEIVTGLEAEFRKPIGTGATAFTAGAGIDLIYEMIGSYDETAYFHWNRRDILQSVAKGFLGIEHTHGKLKTYAVASAQARNVLSGKGTDYAINNTAVNFAEGDFNDLSTRINVGIVYQAKDDLQAGFHLQSASSDNGVDDYAASIRLNWKF